MGSKSHSINLKDYLYEFLDKEIKPVFPKGWMSLEVLKHKLKWITKILPADPKQSVPQSVSSQPGSQPASQSSQGSTQPKQLSPQTSSQSNRVQSQHMSNERVTKSQPIVSEKTHKIEMISVEHNKQTPNATTKTVHNSYQTPNKVSDNLSEGLVSKFMSTPKEIKESVINNSEAINLTSIDLTTKPRSSPKTLNTPTARLSPINLKTSPNQLSMKSEEMKTSSTSPLTPSASPLAMNSILGTYKSSEKSEKLSHEACLTKVIEQSLGDYPNSSANTSNSQRNTKTSLPQTPLPFNEMFAKSFNSTPNTKEQKNEICIEIASSPEPYQRAPQKTQQTNPSKQQTSHTTQHYAQHPKTSTPQPKPTITSTNSTPNLNFMRTPDLSLSKKKYTSDKKYMSLIQPSNANKEQDFRSNQSLLQMSANSSRSSSRDNSMTITPIVSRGNDISVVNTTKQNSNLNSSRHSISSTSSITPTTPTVTETAYMEIYHNYLQSVNNFTNHNIRFPYTPVFQTSIQSPYYPFTTTSSTTSNRTGSKEK